MAPNARPGENAVDIIDGTHKWKPSERSILANDVAPKKVKMTKATDKKQPLVKKAATMVAKSATFTKPKKSESHKFLRIKEHLTYLLSLVTSQPVDKEGSASIAASRSSVAGSPRCSVETGKMKMIPFILTSPWMEVMRTRLSSLVGRG
jgi:hypothetical protein